MCQGKIINDSFPRNLYILMILVLLSTTIASETNGIRTRNYMAIIHSPALTDWGIWGKWVYCHEGDYVRGMRLKIQGPQGAGDDTGLNVITLHCQSVLKNSEYEIESGVEEHDEHHPVYGDDGDMMCCSGSKVAVGFSLRTLPLQWDDRDNMAATDFKLMCSGENIADVVDVRGKDERTMGYWTGEQMCPTGSAVCGFQTQIHTRHKDGPGDRTSLNNVNVACCEMNNPAGNMSRTFSRVGTPDQM